MSPPHGPVSPAVQKLSSTPRGTILILFYTLFDLKEQVKQVPLLQKQLDSVTTLKDSLYDETFRLQIELEKED